MEDLSFAKIDYDSKVNQDSDLPHIHKNIGHQIIETLLASNM